MLAGWAQQQQQQQQQQQRRLCRPVVVALLVQARTKIATQQYSLPKKTWRSAVVAVADGAVVVLRLLTLSSALDGECLTSSKQLLSSGRGGWLGK